MNPVPYASTAIARMFRLYRHAVSTNDERARVLQEELFLETALGAALSVPGVWERIAAFAGIDDPRACSLPLVSSQDVVEGGRTDLTLRWPGGRERDVVLELKVGAPAEEAQIRYYMDAGKDVLSLARFRPHHTLPRRGGGLYLGALTWGDLRDLEGPKGCVPWDQLHHLIDTMGVAMKNVDLSGLTSMMTSWQAWETVETWLYQAEAAVIRAYGPPWTNREKKLIKTHQANQVFGRWMWTTPWRTPTLNGLVGLFMGRSPHAPTTVAGAPDIFLSFQTDPASTLGRSIAADVALKAALERWTKASPGDGVLRESPLPDSSWEFLRARTTSLRLVQVAQGDVELVEWARVRAKELVDCGVIARLNELDAQDRQASSASSTSVSEASGGPGDEEPAQP